MKITMISDTHGRHNLLDLDGGDVLIHCGDITERGYEHEVHHFLKWLKEQDYDYKIFIAGNHDFFFENNIANVKELVSLYNKMDDTRGELIYLEDTSVEIEGLKFYGTPWQPWFYDWAFNLPRGQEDLMRKYAMIPDDTDILITHNPPQNMLDLTRSNDRAGSELLINRILQVKPILNCFGHIHEAYGQKSFHNIQFVNCSVLNHKYVLTFDPVNIEINNGRVLYL